MPSTSAEGGREEKKTKRRERSESKDKRFAVYNQMTHNGADTVNDEIAAQPRPSSFQ